MKTAQLTIAFAGSTTIEAELAMIKIAMVAAQRCMAAGFNVEIAERPLTPGSSRVMRLIRFVDLEMEEDVNYIYDLPAADAQRFFSDLKDKIQAP